MTKQEDGTYSIFLVLPDICRAAYLERSLLEQSEILKEVVDVIRDTVDLRKIENWGSAITTDDQGFKLESEVRALISTEVSGIGRNGNPSRRR